MVATGHLGERCSVVADNGRHVDTTNADLMMAGGDTAEVYNLLYEHVQPSQILHNHRHIFAHKSVVAKPIHDAFACAVNECQRGVQFMYHVGKKLHLFLVYGFAVLLVESGYLHGLSLSLVVAPSVEQHVGQAHKS